MKIDGFEREEERKITTAYMNAYWTAVWMSGKKPESLDKILNRKKIPDKKSMSDEQILGQIKILHKIFGGE
ncbi:MAG: hypothetical protein KMY55_09900 [Dethiosulfatibacter sp.]|nr:hypothetical protein [Dethiosulfatibacter sp.]